MLDTRKHGCLVLLALAVCVKPACAAEKNTASINDDPIVYQPTISFAGFYGTRDNSYSIADALIPVAQHSDRSFFFDARGMMRAYPNNELNVGLAYRWLTHNDSELYGLYMFFDHKRSPLKDNFNQITFGGEWKHANWSLGTNIYIPLGKTQQTLSNDEFAYAEPYQGNKFTIVYGDTTSSEYALTGFDLELGHTIPGLKHMTAYLGAFYFNHKDTKAIAGPRASITYDFSSLLGRSFSWLEHLSVESSYQYDSVRKDIWYTGIRLSIPLGKPRKLPNNPLYRDMTAFIRRDLDVVTENGSRNSPAIACKKDDNTPYIGQIVTTADELNAATTEGSGVDIIAVKGEIDVAGKTYTDSNTEAAVTLLPGQTLTGFSYSFTNNDSGLTHTVDIVNNTHGVTGADPSLTEKGELVLTGSNTGNLLRVATSDSGELSETQLIKNITLTIPEASDSEQQTIFAISNTTGSINRQNNRDSFGHVIIDNVDTNGAMGFSTSSNQGGCLDIQNSTYTIHNLIGRAGAINIVSSASSDISIAAISNNTFNLTNSSPENNAVGLNINYLNGPVTYNTFSDISSNTGTVFGLKTISITSEGSFDNNTFGNLSANAGAAYGVYAQSKMDGSVSNNTFGNISATNANSYGVYVDDTISGNVNNNSFGSIHSQGKYASGVEASDLTSSGSINSNTFESIISDSYESYGISLENMNGTVDSNVFQSISGIDAYAYGIYINQSSGGTLSNNTFTNITSTGSNKSAYGIFVDGALNNTISSNTFSTISSEDNSSYGLYFDGDIANSVDSNTFSAISSGNNTATGLYQSRGNASNIQSRGNGSNITDNIFNTTGSSSRNSIGIQLPTGSSVDSRPLEKNNSFGGNIPSRNKVVIPKDRR